MGTTMMMHERITTLLTTTRTEIRVADDAFGGMDGGLTMIMENA